MIFVVGILLVRKQVSYARVYCVMTLAIFAVGRSIAMIPDYSKAKTAALRIIKLHKRQSHIDPTDDSGIILVRLN